MGTNSFAVHRVFFYSSHDNRTACKNLELSRVGWACIVLICNVVIIAVHVEIYISGRSSCHEI